MFTHRYMLQEALHNVGGICDVSYICYRTKPEDKTFRKDFCTHFAKMIIIELYNNYNIHINP